MELTSLLRLFKGATPLDFIMYAIVTFLAIRAGLVELKGRKPAKEKHMARHVTIVNRVNKIVAEKTFTYYYRTMREQMRVCESAIDSVARLMRDTFFERLKSRGYTASQILKMVDVKHYNAVVEILASRVRMDVRTMLRENRLSEKTEIEMQVYVNSKFEILVETGRVVFDIYYAGDDLIISRPDLHEIHKSIFGRISTKFSEVIRECRDISVKADGKIEILEQQLEDIRNSPCNG